MSAKYCFTIDQGTDLRVPFVLKNADGTLVDLTGCAIRMQLRKNFYADEAVDTLTTDDGRITMTPAEGRFELVFPNSTTAGYPVQTLVYDIELVSSGGEVRRIVEGKASVTPEVTRVD